MLNLDNKLANYTATGSGKIIEGDISLNQRYLSNYCTTKKTYQLSNIMTRSRSTMIFMIGCLFFAEGNSLWTE